MYCIFHRSKFYNARLSNTFETSNKQTNKQTNSHETTTIQLIQPSCEGIRGQLIYNTITFKRNITLKKFFSWWSLDNDDDHQAGHHLLFPFFSRRNPYRCVDNARWCCYCKLVSIFFLRISQMLMDVSRNSTSTTDL